jgi:hypothetical protein
MCLCLNAFDKHCLGCYFSLREFQGGKIKTALKSWLLREPADRSQCIHRFLEQTPLALVSCPGREADFTGHSVKGKGLGCQAGEWAKGSQHTLPYCPWLMQAFDEILQLQKVGSGTFFQLSVCWLGRGISLLHHVWLCRLPVERILVNVVYQKWI